MAKISAVVILYNPQQTIEKNIQSYRNKIDKLYLIDNSETEQNISSFALNKDNSQIIADKTNEGIAKRLNQACTLALNDGFDFLLTMDQDSFFDDNVIKKYLNCIDEFGNKSNVAMFGINHEQQNETLNCDYTEVKHLITSGSVINLNLFRETGGFDENLFIDFVDTEYCFRAAKKGFRIIEFPNLYMHHSLGTVVEKYSLRSFKKTARSFHSATRLYYMTRNFYYLNEKYQILFPKELQILKKDLLNRIKNKLLYEPKRFTTIKNLYKAIQDFKNNRMGKLPD